MEREGRRLRRASCVTLSVDVSSGKHCHQLSHLGGGALMYHSTALRPGARHVKPLQPRARELHVTPQRKLEVGHSAPTVSSHCRQ